MNKKLVVFMVLIMASISLRGECFAGMHGALKNKVKSDEVVIDSGGIEIPLGYILLIRKDDHCCALKFKRNWTEVDEERKGKFESYVARGIMDAESAKDAYEKRYSAYVVYYQGDGSADFSRNNVVKQEHVSSWLPLKGPFRPFIYQPGDAHVICGSFKLVWVYKTGVSFIPTGKGLGDYGIALAPTPWTDISEVNVRDPRIKWYRYDEQRKRINIPIDKLWEDTVSSLF
jgi:hypothetical protein